MKRMILTVSVVLCLALPAAAKERKIRGYVTNINSPTSFEIEDYRITRDLNLVLEFEKAEGEVAVDFRPEDIRVGTELEIKGDYNEQTGELRAKSIKVILEEYKKIKRTALIEHAPALERSDDGWVGTFFADGQRIRVEPPTRVVFKPNKSEKNAFKERERAQHKKAAERKQKGKPQAEVADDEEDDHYARPLQSLEEIRPNTFMTYEGHREEDDSIRALKVEFVRNELEKGEAKNWKTLTPKIKEPNYLQGKPGEVKIPRVGKFKLVPSQEAQHYIQQLGERLIPPYQRSLAAGDPNKLPFKFYLAQAKVANAFALENGVIVVFSPMFEVLENEAQLAAVMGHELAHAVQEHQRRQREYHRKKLMAMRIGAAVGAVFGGQAVADIANLIEAAIRNGYSRSLENQADRVGLQYLLQGGYDAREAPRVWKMMAKKYGDHPTNFFWSRHDNHTTRRSYLLAELRMNYPDVDYNQLKKNQEEFQRIAALVQGATAKKKKVKVKS